MTTEIAYTCKFCHTPRAVDADIPDGWSDQPPGYKRGVSLRIPLEISIWQSMLACNRCADFERSRRDQEDRILKAAGALLIARANRLNPSALDAASRKIDERLCLLTKELATIICDHYHKMDVWDREFVNQIMDQPEKTNAALRFYHRSVSRL